VEGCRAHRLIAAAEEAARVGAFTKAITLFKSAVRLDPHRPGTHLDLADLFFALAMEREARRWAMEALTRAVASCDQKTGAAALAFLVALDQPCDPH
jgi:hypothetical protein